MKVALVDPSLFTWSYDKALASGLASLGHEVTLYTKHLHKTDAARGDPITREMFYPLLNRALIRRMPKKVFLALKGLSHIGSMFRLLRHLSKAPPDVIHFQWLPLPAVDRLFLKAFGRIAPIVYTAHDTKPFNGNPSSRLQVLGVDKLLQSLDHVIVHTKAGAQTLRTTGVPARSICVIPHGALGPKEGTLDKRSMTADGSRLKLLMFGFVKPYKGIDLAIQAVAKLTPEDRRRVSVHVAGTPQMDVEELKKLSADLGVDSCFTWQLRFISDEEVEGLFNGSNASLMPYRQIDASGVLTLAMVHGHPVIASRLGLFAEMLVDGVHGFVVEPGDVTGLAQAISRMANDPSERLAMAARMRALHSSMPTWEAIAQQTVDLYERSRRDSPGVGADVCSLT